MTTILASGSAGTGTLPNYLYLSSYSGIDRTGVSDSHTGFINAISTCVAGKMTLVVDCPVRLTIGFNITLPIIIPSFLNVDFTSNGVLLVDNVFQPALCFLHTTDCIWNNTHIQYVGSCPLDISGSPAYSAASQGWNDTTVKNYLISNFNNTFSSGASAQNNGVTNAMAVVAFRGGNSRLTFNNFLMDVPQASPCTQFIPVGISFDAEWTPATAVASSTTPPTSANSVIPQDIVINNLIMDGYLMGLVGAGGITLNNPIWKRYSDLQDASYITNGVGANWGGIDSSVSVGSTGYGGWFPTPHAACLQSLDPSLAVPKIINNAIDYGMYVGGSTRRSSSAGSGPMCSIKVAPQFGTRINGFKTFRPDGLIDVLSAAAQGTPGGGELNDLEAPAYDSSLTYADSAYFPAVRFTQSNPYTALTINRLSVTDVASAPVVWSISVGSYPSNYCVEINDLQYRLNDVPANGWGFNVSGTNVKLTGDVYLKNCTTTKTSIGLLATSTAKSLKNSFHELRLWGWRVLNSLVFSTPPSGTGGTLSKNWLFPTDAYVVTFPSGQQRLVTFTINSNYVTWVQALPAAETSASFSVNIITAGNILQYQDVQNFGGGATGVYAKITDVSNCITQECDNGIITETWSQQYVGSPLGATQATTLTFPQTFAIDRVGCAVVQNLGTVPSFNVGWTGTPNALLATQSSSTNGNSFSLVDTTWPRSLAGVTRNILLTPTSGAFDGTGLLKVTARGIRMYGTA